MLVSVAELLQGVVAIFWKLLLSFWVYYLAVGVVRYDVQYRQLLV